MNNLSIRQRIIAGFSVILMLIVIMSGVAFINLQRIGADAKEVQTRQIADLYTSGALKSGWEHNFYLYQKQAPAGASVDRGAVRAELTANRDALKKLAEDQQTRMHSDTERRDFQAFEAARDRFSSLQDTLRELDENAVQSGEAQRLREDLDTAFLALTAALDRLELGAKARADALMQNIAESNGRAERSLVVSFVIAMLLALACGYLILRAITNPLERLVSAVKVMSTGDFTQPVSLDRRDEFGALGDGFNRMVGELTALVGQVQSSGIQVNSSVTQIAATAREQQATASEIAATTTEIGATSREISATSRELVKTMNEVSSVAEQTAELATNGQGGLARMDQTMQHVMEAAGTINAKLSVLNEKAGNINQVVTTIAKVADQTNLLSLNAAIEAEKAGEHGRGFAVVATEIRRLADQTAVATVDIEQRVKEIQSAVTAGVMGMDKFADEVRRGMEDVQHVAAQLSKIIQYVQTLAPRVLAVNEGMQAQATGAEQISEALRQLSEASQQTVESLRQSNDAINGLNQVSTGLRSAVSRFRLQPQG